MEPEWRLVGILLFPGIPRENRIRFSCDKAPVVCADVFLVENRENRFKRAAMRARHVFRADHRTMEMAERLNFGEHFLRRVVVVKSDDVGIFELQFFHRAQLRVVGEIEFLPDAAGERLRRLCAARPDPDFCEKLFGGLRLVRQFGRFVVAVFVVGLVHQIPDHDAPIVAKSSDNCLNVRLDFRGPARGIFQDFGARRLHPAGIVRVRLGVALFADLRVRIPNRVEQHEHDANVVLVGYAKKFVHAIEKAGGILFPREVMQEHAHRVHADVLRPAEFAIVGGEVEGVGLPHFELVDRIRRNEVAADEPGLRGVPVVGAFHRPAIFRRVFGRRGLGGRGETAQR